MPASRSLNPSINSDLLVQPVEIIQPLDQVDRSVVRAEGGGATETTATPTSEASLPLSPVSIEGIRISSGESPVRTQPESSSTAVSIVQDATDDEIKRFILARTLGPHPVILSSTRVPYLTPDQIDTVIEVSQFERQIIKEAIVSGVNRVIGGLSPTLGKAAQEEHRRSLKEADDRISALSYLKDTMDTAASGLNVSRMSQQIMRRANEGLAQILAPTEASNPTLPANLDDYLSLTFPGSVTSAQVDSYLTNTGRLVMLAQDMTLACLSAHPLLMNRFSRTLRSDGSSLFSIPDSYSYDPDGPEGPLDSRPIPTVTDMFSRNVATIKGQFLVRNPPFRANPGFISTAGSGDEMWDSVTHSICVLSSEMIISAGIGRLQGSKLGNRFLERSSDSLEFDPFTRLLGLSPTERNVSKFFGTGPDRPGSFLDLLALGEEVADRDFIVMPFETNTVVYRGTPYVSGRQYFIEMATQIGSPDMRAALRRFATQYGALTRDMSSYMTELVALDTETPLSPELLFARILQDIRDVAASISDGVAADENKSAFVATLFALSGCRDTKRVQTGIYRENGRLLDVVSAPISDIIKMSVVKALKELDSQLENKTYLLSQESTGYSFALPEENPESRLGLLIDNLKIQGVTSKTEVEINDILSSPSGVEFDILYYQPDSGTQLYDTNFKSSNNLINMVARTIREIQREALNLAQRNDAKSDYRNAQGGTLLSNCDDDRLIDVVSTIYMNLAYLLLPVTLINKRNIRSAFQLTSAVVYSTSQAAKLTGLLTDIINTIVNGGDITTQGVFERVSLDPETPISLSPFGDNAEVSTPASVVRAAEKMPKQRYYIKASLKILESVAAGVTASSAKMGRVFDILSDSVPARDLKDQDVTLYDTFVRQSERYSDLLRNLSDSQVNLCIPARRALGQPSVTALRGDIDTTTAERLALGDFIKSVYGQPSSEGRSSLSGLHVMSVGVPSGMLESLYSPAFELEGPSSGFLASRGTESDFRRRYIRIEVDRFDNAYYNAVSNMYPNIFGLSPSETEFDPEIFLFSDSISYDPKSWPTGAVSVNDAIFLSTTFYRVRRGRVVESVLGSDVPVSEVRFYYNVLKSYLLDLYLYETVGVRYSDGVSPYGAPRLSQSGLELVKSAASDPIASRALMCPTGFDRIFDPRTGQVKTGEPLRSVLTPVSSRNSAPFSALDVKFASTLACTAPMSAATDIVSYRPYERIYHFFYDESVIRNQIPGDTLDQKRKRRQFDIYSLSARVSYGGGT
jgi:hypothetical protein